jgi:hypothetical protein
VASLTLVREQDRGTNVKESTFQSKEFQRGQGGSLCADKASVYQEATKVLDLPIPHHRASKLMELRLTKPRLSDLI